MSERFGVRLYKQSFNFASAHFLLFADGRRECLHGHNYQVRIEIEGRVGPGELVADFIKLKPLIREICDTLDHRVIIPLSCPALTLTRSTRELEVLVSDGSRFVFPLGDVVLIPLNNTSTERLAEYIGGQLCERFAKAMPELIWSRLRVEVEESGGQCGWHERGGMSGESGEREE